MWTENVWLLYNNYGSLPKLLSWLVLFCRLLYSGSVIARLRFIIAVNLTESVWSWSYSLVSSCSLIFSTCLFSLRSLASLIELLSFSSILFYFLPSLSSPLPVRPFCSLCPLFSLLSPRETFPSPFRPFLLICLSFLLSLFFLLAAPSLSSRVTLVVLGQSRIVQIAD